MIYEFYSSIIFLIIVTFISLAILYINVLFVKETYDPEKNSMYECGFQPVDLNLEQFEIKYYVIGLLFLIFDIEIAFLIPFISISFCFNIFIIFCFFTFLFSFYLTFLYEWKNKYLDWE